MFWLVTGLALTTTLLTVRLMHLSVRNRAQEFEIKELTAEKEILSEALKVANKRLNTTKYF